MKQELENMVSEIGQEVIDEVLEEYFEEIRDDLKRIVRRDMGDDIKSAAKEKFIEAVGDYINSEIENNNLLEE